MRSQPVYLQGTIPEFEYPRRDLPANVRLVGALLPEAPGGSPLPPWWDELRASRPVVLVTQGTVKIDPAVLLEPSIDAMANDDILLVGTTGGARRSRSSSAGPHATCDWRRSSLSPTCCHTSTSS